MEPTGSQCEIRSIRNLFPFLRLTFLSLIFSDSEAASAPLEDKRAMLLSLSPRSALRLPRFVPSSSSSSSSSQFTSISRLRIPRAMPSILAYSTSRPKVLVMDPIKLATSEQERLEKKFDFVVRCSLSLPYHPFDSVS